MFPITRKITQVKLPVASEAALYTRCESLIIGLCNPFGIVYTQLFLFTKVLTALNIKLYSY